MILYYILDEQGNPTPEPDRLKFAQWFETADRQVAETFFGDIRVSTVFLGMPHVDKESGDLDRLYETMIFAEEPVLARLMELSETDDRSIMAIVLGRAEIQKCYRTKEEAKDGHRRMCIFIETCVTTGLLPRGGNIDDTTGSVGQRYHTD